MPEFRGHRHTYFTLPFSWLHQCIENKAEDQHTAMESVEEGRTGVKERRVHDSSVDYHGRIPLRASTGGWKAALFIIGIEFAERLSYYGIASNLIIYLTKVLQEDVKTAAKSVNDWVGVTTVVPLVGGFLADAYVGRFWMVMISSIIYLLGLGLLTLSETLPFLKATTCTSINVCSYRTHKLAFYLALYLISLGTGGHKPSLESFGADQFDEDDEVERKQKISFFNWWYLGLCGGTVLGVTLVVYLEDYMSWGTGFGVLTATTAMAIVFAGIGVPYYRYRVPQGSPLTPMLKVLVASFANRELTLPADPSLLYEPDAASVNSQGRRRLRHTPRLRFLDKAAIVDHDSLHNSLDDSLRSSHRKIHQSWRRSTVTEVEETKQLLSMVPIWLFTLAFGVSIVQGQTFFIKQAVLMNRTMFTPHFQIPPASLVTFSAFSMIVFVPIYDRFFVPILRRITGDERGITILQRIGIGMAICIASLVSAALVEKKRRNSASVIRVLWLSPEFILLGLVDVFTLVGLQEYFYDQVPDNMRSLGIAFYLSVIGVASFLSSFLITIVDSATRRFGKQSWFQKDLNDSRVDYFYWLLAVLSSLNLCAYVWIAKRYTYKGVDKGHKVHNSNTV